MEDNYEEYLFTPKCFEKDLKKIFKYMKTDKKNKTLFKGSGKNRIFEINHKNSYAYLTSIYADLSPGLILEKLKEYNHLKLWFPYIEDINSLMRISQYCDILGIDVSLPILNIFNINTQMEIIRYWSYDNQEHSYFLMFKTFRNKIFCDNIENGGFIINVNPNVVRESGCILTFFIKFKKSKYSCLIDHVYKSICREFCSSLENFIGSVKMHKYNLIMNEKLNTPKSESGTVDSYKYLIHYFTGIELEDAVERRNSLAYKNTEIDTNDKNLMKSYFEVKNYISYNFNDNIFNENEVVRYVVGLKGNTSLIINCLEELYNFRKSLKIDIEEFSDMKIDLNEYIYIFGEDKHKRPVIVVKLNLFNLCINFSDCNLVNKIIHYFIYVFNKSIEMMAPYIDKYVVIVDVKNLNLNFKDIPTEVFKRLFNIFHKFYTERLGDLIIIHKGIFFNLLWKKVSALVESYEIMNKIKISNNYLEELSGILDTEKLNNL